MWGEMAMRPMSAGGPRANAYASMATLKNRKEKRAERLGRAMDEEDDLVR
jgi:hypothetical protein